jgi:hypothetical protein
LLYLSPKQRHRKCAIYRGEGGAGDATADASNAAALADSFADAANASAGQAATSASAALAAQIAAELAETNAETAETNAEAAEAAAVVAKDAAEAVLLDTGFTVVASDLQGTDTIGTVAADIVNVNAVANNIDAVIAVDANEANINIVAADGTDIGTVATSIANVNSVATNMLDVTAVADNETNIDTVAGIAANVTTVAGISGNVTTVAGVSANVTTVAGISANVTTVAGISSDVTSVATNNTNVSTVATNIASVNTNATNIVAIQNASANAISAADSASAAAISASAAAASFDAFNDIYLGAKASNPTVDNDGDPLTTGDQYFNTVANELRVWNGSSWQAASVIGGTVDSINVNNVATFSAGTVSAPAITTTGDTNTGIFFPAADTIAFTEGGVEAMRIDSSGNVGIGDSSPNARLHVHTSTVTDTSILINNGAVGDTGGIRLTTLASAEGQIFHVNQQPLIFGTNNTERMRIEGLGNVGIGTSSPASKLHVSQTYSAPSGGISADTTGLFTKSNTPNGNCNISILSRGTGFSRIYFGSDVIENAGAIEVAGGSASGAGSMRFYTNDGTVAGTERMRIDSSGQVIVGPFGGNGNAIVAGSSSIAGFTNQPGTNLLLKSGDGSGAGSSFMSFSTSPAGSSGSALNTAAERMRIDSSGNVFVGASGSFLLSTYASKFVVNNTGGANLGIGGGSNTTNTILSRFTTYNSNNGNAGNEGSTAFFGITSIESALTTANSNASGDSGGYIMFRTKPDAGALAERMRIDSSGNVGIGTSSPDALLSVNGIASFGAGAAATPSIARASDLNTGFWFPAADTIAASTGGSERMRIDASGNVLINGTVDAASTGGLTLNNTTSGSAATPLALRCSGTGNGSGSQISFRGVSNASAEHDYGYIGVVADDTTAKTGSMRFSTTAGSSPLERMRITSGGNLLVGKTAEALGIAGIDIGPSYMQITRSGDSPLDVNRLTNDGDLVRFFQATTQEGSISVSGTTVSYNGGHLARWSQLLDGSKDDAILKGTVMSNLDDMCVWEKDGVVAENEQLNKMKVSDVEGDTNVAGVFVNWTMDDAYGVDDMNVAMTGDMIIRIADGVVVQKGDLLMSAGDGTAKPQGDDIVRSKTIAKVTSNYVTCTYADGSYCVPCVLMAC